LKSQGARTRSSRADIAPSRRCAKTPNKTIALFWNQPACGLRRRWACATFAVDKLPENFSFPSMKSLAGLVVAVFLLTGVSRAEERFSQTLSPADFTAAGLDQLKPDQLARLDEFARAFQARAQQKTPTAAAPQPAGQLQPAPGNATPAKSAGSGVRYGIKSPKPAASAPEISRIVGTITGWKADTVFRLENGEVWTVANADRYSAPPMTNPAVQIRPATVFGGYWMQIESLPEVRVRLVAGADAPPEK
jgi:hypothetical protein